MVHGTMLSLKPAEKYIAKWLRRSLEGLPKCALVPPGPGGPWQADGPIHGLAGDTALSTFQPNLCPILIR